MLGRRTFFLGWAGQGSPGFMKEVELKIDSRGGGILDWPVPGPKAQG
jgi:hypothetical protein